MDDTVFVVLVCTLAAGVTVAMWLWGGVRGHSTAGTVPGSQRFGSRGAHRLP